MTRSRAIAVIAALLAAAAAVAVVVIVSGGSDEDGTTPQGEPAAQQRPDAGEGRDADGDGDPGPEEEEELSASEPDRIPEASIERIDPPKRVRGADNSIQEFGSEAEGEDAEEILAAFGGFLAARAEGDWEAACWFLQDHVFLLFSRMGRRSAGEDQGSRTGCAAYFESLPQQPTRQALRRQAQVRLGAIRLEDDRAFVIHRSAASKRWLAMPMLAQDGRWRVGALEPVPLR